ncbi:MAG: hypothetical protein V8R92_07450 [Eubacterium sp.]|uniref:hypothetical protein n=1 Tax=Eubacterium sp. TaxID=142586 RepID=UPI00300F7133
MNKAKFNFELKDTMSPEEVIIESARDIGECTNEMVICNVGPYDGETKSYIKKNSYATIARTLQSMEEETVDIQDSLGEQSGIENKYEVFLSVKGLEYYKYRIMFLKYGAIAYPVQVVLNEDIAEAYNGKKQYIYDVESMQDLKTMFETIMNTDFCTNLIQSLIYESMRQSRKNNSEK